MTGYSQPRRGLAFNVVWTGAGAGVSQGAIFVANIVFARLLGVSAMADYVVVQTLMVLVPAIFSFGLERVGPVLLANTHPLGLSRRIRDIFAVVLASSLIAGGGVFATVTVGSFINARGLLVTVLVAAVLAAENSRIMVGDLPRTWGRADMALLSGPASPRVFVLAAALVWQFGLGREVGLEFILVASLVGSAGASLLGIALTTKLGDIAAKVPATAERLSLRQGGSVREIARAGIPMAVANIALVVLGQVDTLVAASAFAPAVVASYGVVSRTSNLIGNLKTMLGVALVPSLSRKPSSAEDAARQLMLSRLVMTGLFWSVLPVALLAGLFASAFFSLLFGQALAVASVAGPWLAGGQIFSVAMGTAGSVLLRDGRQIVIMWTQVASAVVSLAGMLAAAALHSVQLLGAVSGAGTALCALIMGLALWMESRERSWILGPRAFVSALGAAAQSRKRLARAA